MTCRIHDRHIINGLVRVGALHKVVEDVSKKDLILRTVTVQQRNLCIGIVVADGSMEGTIDNKHAYVWSGSRHLPPQLSQLIFPPLPELWSVLITHSDDSVCGAVQDQDWGLNIGPGCCSTIKF